MPRRFLPEVQGLRAVAVLLVLVYHLNAAVLPGGYVGVDVFFVISGFLITSLLLREVHDHGRISVSQFYVRRVRRILPAATLVLLATGIATVLLLPVTRLEQATLELAASAAYIENFVLAAQTVDYLAAEERPARSSTSGPWRWKSSSTWCGRSCSWAGQRCAPASPNSAVNSSWAAPSP